MGYELQGASLNSELLCEKALILHPNGKGLGYISSHVSTVTGDLFYPLMTEQLKNNDLEFNMSRDCHIQQRYCFVAKVNLRIRPSGLESSS